MMALDKVWWGDNSSNARAAARARNSFQRLMILFFELTQGLAAAFQITKQTERFYSSHPQVR
jgi:hypothetical protein